ncbi:MAG: GntR family transcriptional regulator [Synergistetes bacterium]|nr:GntR family transcriptional regulator [Synergistota bacterium]MCX8127705.1 GntR family transcriptional regulator [Synergistota bacterium]
MNHKVYEILKEAILKGDLKGGSRLVESQLASQLGTSRTPVREAIHRLAAEGLVELLPNQGAFVAEISLKDIEDVFQIRSALEGLAVRLFTSRCGITEIEKLNLKLKEMKLACERKDVIAYADLDASFHKFIWAFSGNDRLLKVLESMMSYIDAYRLKSLYVPGVMESSLKDHEEIISLVSQKKAEEVEELMREHIENVLKRIKGIGRGEP